MYPVDFIAMGRRRANSRSRRKEERKKKSSWSSATSVHHHHRLSSGLPDGVPVPGKQPLPPGSFETDDTTINTYNAMSSLAAASGPSRAAAPQTVPEAGSSNSSTGPLPLGGSADSALLLVHPPNHTNDPVLAARSLDSQQSPISNSSNNLSKGSSSSSATSSVGQSSKQSSKQSGKQSSKQSSRQSSKANVSESSRSRSSVSQRSNPSRAKAEEAENAQERADEDDDGNNYERWEDENDENNGNDHHVNISSDDSSSSGKEKLTLLASVGSWLQRSMRESSSYGSNANPGEREGEVDEENGHVSGDQDAAAAAASSTSFKAWDDKDEGSSPPPIGGPPREIGGSDMVTSKMAASSGGRSGSNSKGSVLRSILKYRPLLFSMVFGAMAMGLLFGVYMNRFKIADVDPFIDWDVTLNVAFMGNAYLFVNDIPRLMEAVSGGHIYQESVIHASSGSLPSLLMRGNGMYRTWQTEAAYLTEYANDEGENETIYDYGMCTVAQILLGRDEILSYGNEDGAYINDYKNPCIMDENYYNFIQDQLDADGYNNNNNDYAKQWDYIVLVDQTKRMAVEDARQESIYSLSNAYGPLIAKTGGIPVIVDTHAFWSDQTNMTGLESVRYFQALIYDGVQDYVEALASVLPESQAPLVAPIGIAYLTIYEESQDSYWPKLFIDDDMHASVHGSYLFACVLYATLFGHLPSKSVSAHNSIDLLFQNCRKIVGYTDDMEYPTQNEAFYYRNVAKRVALNGYVPRSLLKQIQGVDDDAAFEYYEDNYDDQYDNFAD